ncbi:tRNA uridine-5-carboxymethylaminomethyl(34) synthesis GTPase MnmE [Oceaniglobus ichthyenteri]|uniref:tRNA uridine-5-carboxymethylaminomethyl(34) synthesis GTPase MnmE n=1 Tax=Oceaniglobus ichthyenteri TaxID=2136177 RepID=UPI000D37B90A|nr:tRNA uridine-5-carboxymethylaminomethyl(34) synthesis GTPase MnmE [Oceaniglobus ichthyenteri]
METIFAPATARGKAGVTVTRISGPSAFAACQTLVGDVPPAHRASLRIIRDTDGAMLDEGLVITFPAGKSFTGEETVELQTHGSIAITNAILRRLGDLPDLRLAEPGEFTKRALYNNRLDLTQVEGLADLIEAETEVQRKQAQRVLSGEIGALTEGWRRNLIRAAALLEATIDFADEEVPIDVSPEVTSLIDTTLRDLQQQASGSHAAERVRDSFEVAIIGAPNIGKSTLLNALAGRDAAITSEIAGTTRDVIEVRMEIDGLPVTLLDTAGLRETSDQIEQIGVDRAKKRASMADLRIALVQSVDESLGVDLEEDDLIYLGKGDLADGTMRSISGKTGAGIDLLLKDVSDRLQQRAGSASIMIRERHRIALQRGIEALFAAKNVVGQGPDQAELAAESLRSAVRALDSLVGRIGVEDVLDEVFATFCLGK